MIEQRIKCSFGEYQVPAVVHAVQGDTARRFIFEPSDYQLTGGESASLFCVRPNGTAYSYPASISSTNNTITVDLDDDGGALTQAGVVAAQLVLSISGEEGKSFKLGIIVEECLGGTATTEDITFLESLQAQLNAALSSYKVNGQAFGANTTLKSAQFSQAITGELMLANLTYTNRDTWTDGKSIKLANDIFLNVSGIDGIVRETLTGAANIDALITNHQSGTYYCSNTSTTPETYGMLVVISAGVGTADVYHIFIPASANSVYIRYRNASAWGNWYKYSGVINGYDKVKTVDATISAPDSTVTKICELSLEPGYYIISGWVIFPSNANGTYRNATLRQTNESGNVICASQCPPVSGATTRCLVSYPITLSSASTMVLVCQHNAGSELASTQGHLRAMQIA